MSARVELRLSGPMDHLRLVWQVGESLLESVPFRDDPEGSRYNALLATQEMLTNVLRYAHRGDVSMPVEVELAVDAEGFTVAIRDHGPEFDPRSRPQPGPVLQDGMLRTGGYGILIARMVMDSIDYRREGDCNVLTMHKAVGARVASSVRG